MSNEYQHPLGSEDLSGYLCAVIRSDQCTGTAKLESRNHSLCSPVQSILLADTPTKARTISVQEMLVDTCVIRLYAFFTNDNQELLLVCIAHFRGSWRSSPPRCLAGCTARSVIPHRLDVYCWLWGTRSSGVSELIATDSWCLS